MGPSINLRVERLTHPLTVTGGTIQNTTGHAISLNSTLTPSFNFIKIQNIAITNFPSGAGIQVIGGNSNAGQAVTIASSGSPLLINGNTITGSGAGSAGIGTNGIAVTAGESTTAYFSIGASGAANNITNVRGDGIDCSLFGNGTEKCIIAFNIINANTILNVTRLSGVNFNKPTSVMDPRIWEFSTTYSF